jgi:hypothetical protein
MTDHEQALAERAAAYSGQLVRLANARNDLAEEVRAAHRDGMRKADILRAIDHVWSREWLDRTIAEPGGTP